LTLKDFGYLFIYLLIIIQFFGSLCFKVFILAIHFLCCFYIGHAVYFH